MYHVVTVTMENELVVCGILSVPLSLSLSPHLPLAKNATRGRRRDKMEEEKNHIRVRNALFFGEEEEEEEEDEGWVSSWEATKAQERRRRRLSFSR